MSENNKDKELHRMSDLEVKQITLSIHELVFIDDYITLMIDGRDFENMMPIRPLYSVALITVDINFLDKIGRALLKAMHDGSATINVSEMDLYLLRELCTSKADHFGYKVGLSLKRKVLKALYTNTNKQLDFLDQLDSRLVTTGEKLGTTFGDMGDIAADSANERIAANNKAAEEEIKALKSSRKFQRMSAEAQLKEEQKVRDKLEKQNRKAKKKANKLKAAEFRINQIIKIREAIMNTQTAVTAALDKPWLVALIAAQGAAAVATIAAQKPPRMERGGYIGGRRHSQGGTLIEAERGEFIMSRNAVESVGLEAMNRINQGGGGAINVNFTGNVLSSDFIEEEAIPQIRDAIRRGADIGVG